MYTDINGPPIAEYEQIVEPIAACAKTAGLDRRDGKSDFNERNKKDRRSREQNTKEMLREPFVGLLFDFNV